MTLSFQLIEIILVWQVISYSNQSMMLSLQSASDSTLSILLALVFLFMHSLINFKVGQFSLTFQSVNPPISLQFHSTTLNFLIVASSNCYFSCLPNHSHSSTLLRLKLSVLAMSWFEQAPCFCTQSLKFFLASYSLLSPFSMTHHLASR